MWARVLPALTLGVVTLTTPLGAQYTAVGSTVRSGGVPDLQTAVEETRWRFGPLRLDPWVGLRDASFVLDTDAQGERRDDFTATAGAGLRAYVRTGARVIWTVQALPEYTWWHEAEEKRRLNGRYGAGLFVYFNRLQLELSHRRAEQQSFFSPEIRQLTTTRQDTSRFAFALGLGRRIELVGAASRGEAAAPGEDDPVFALLDREDERARLGFRYRTPTGWTLGLGYEDTTSRFADRARNLSNTGTAGLVSLRYDGNRITGALELSVQSLRADSGSEFGDRDTTTGNLEILLRLRGNANLALYGHRRLDYALSSSSSTYLSDRIGSRLELTGRKSLLVFFAEVGEDEYAAIDVQQADRRDKVTAYGLDYRLDLRQKIRLTLGINRTEFDSDHLFDRDTTTWSAGIDFSGLLRGVLGTEEEDRTW